MAKERATKALLWLPRVTAGIAALLSAAIVSLVAAKLVNWSSDSSQTCLLCQLGDSVESWLCYAVIGVGGAGAVVAVLLLFLPIAPQLQSVIAWVCAALFAALSGLLTKFALPAYSAGSQEGAFLLATYASGWAAVVVWMVLSVERCCVPQTQAGLGSSTKLQRSKSLDLESQPDTKRTPRSEVWWSVALKAPLDPRLGFTGHDVQYRDSDSDASCPGWTFAKAFTVQHWLQSHLSRDTRTNTPWTGFALYSDEPPALDPSACRPDPARHGACKGVVVWNRERMGWLIHTVPCWPPAQGMQQDGGVPPLPLEQSSQGQSFVFVSLPLTKLREVHAQLNVMQAFIYATCQDGIYSFAMGPAPGVMVSRLVLGAGMYHVAKRSEWKGDLFGDGLAEKSVFGICGGPLHAQSWREHGTSLLPNIDADNVQQVMWANGTPYGCEQDRACWAVSATSAKHRWSFLGDLSRVEEHMTRGGGGIVLRDAALWKTFVDTVDEWDGSFGK